MSIVSKVKALVQQSRSAADELGAGLQQVRSRIEELAAEREHIELANVAIETALARVDQFIAFVRQPLDQMSVGDFLAVDGFRAINPMPANADRFALALLADQWGETLKAKIRAKLAEQPGLSDADRKATLARLDRDLLDHELVEESLIRSAERAGFDVLRRHNANPLAVLAADEAMPS